VLVLAFGIGVNTTVFTLANALFLRPLPVSDPAAIVRVYANRFTNVPYPAYLELRDRNSTLTGLAAFQMQSFGLRVDTDVEHTFGEIVTGNYFPLLGVAAARGRLLEPSDDVAGAAPVVVLSHAFWIRRFGGSADVAGRTIVLSGQPFTIVGVAARDFTGVLSPLAGDLWVPLATDVLVRPALDQQTRFATMSFHLMGRLKPGIDRARAQADLDAIGRQVRQAAGQQNTGPAVAVYGSTMLHPEASQPVTAFTAVLLTVVALVLLVVCVNANLVLARAIERHAELAVRQSLGAARGRLIRQLLTENLLLSVAGAAGGLAIAYWCGRVVKTAHIPAPVPLLLDLSLDARVLAFTTLVAVVATLAFGILPALTASRIDLVSALKGMTGDGRHHSRLRSAFLVAQVSMSVLLLIVAGLFIRGFRNAQSIDLGFDIHGVMTASLDLETRGYSAVRGREFIRSLTDRLNRAPGVASANIVDIVPVTLSNTTGYLLRTTDPEPAPNQPPVTPQVYINAVGDGHFRTLKITLLEGRDFTRLDNDSSPHVAIVNERLAQRFWPGQRAVGQRLRPAGSNGNPREVIEIVGVVRNSKYISVGEEPRPFLYRPLAQAYTPRITMLVRSTGSPAAALSTMKQAVRELDSGLAVFNAATLAETTAISLLPARIAGILLAALGLLALVLAALGTYGVLSFLVRARTREIGIRVAIGARPATVAFLIARQAMIWTIIGAFIGVSLALGLTRFIQSFLYGVSPTDALTFTLVTSLLATVAGIAALLPAWRASRIDPLVALRSL
jgi:putative ABC transport system permease protein